MRIAFYNIENLFFRHCDFSSTRDDHEKKTYVVLDKLLEEQSPNFKHINRIRQLCKILEFERRDRMRVGKLAYSGCFLQYFDGRENLDKAKAENEWEGWINIINYPLKFQAISNKALTIAEANPDILFLHQVEDKESLELFNKRFLAKYPFENYVTSDVFAGNDKRCIGHGIYLRINFNLREIYTKHYIRDAKGELLFDRDFGVYRIETPRGKHIWVIFVEMQVNGNEKHLQDERRLLQSKKVAMVYHELRERGITEIILMGSFYALPYCYSLAPIFNSGLKEISRHPKFIFEKDYGKMKEYYSLGSYKKGLNLKQYDYLFLSPELYSKIKACGLNRKGIWPGKQGKWSTYFNLKNKGDQASSHPLLWVELDI